MLLTPRRSGTAVLLAALVVGWVAFVLISLLRADTPGGATAVAPAGRAGGAAGAASGAHMGPIRLAPGLIPGTADPNEPPPTTPGHIGADLRVTEQMLASLDDTLAELKRERKYDEVTMVERKQAELRAKLSQSRTRVQRLSR